MSSTEKGSEPFILFFSVIALLLGCVLTGLSAHARSAAQIDTLVLDEMAKQNIVGMAVGIVRHGTLYYTNGYGHADLARTRPITTETIFRWGSISKTLTATAALQLAELNPAFSLNDRVTEHVDYWPDAGPKGNIRIRHLLSNRSGIIHYKKKKHCPANRAPRYVRSRHSSKSYNAEQAVAVFSDQKLCFEPGTGYKYSTFGYNLLGSAIEGGSGIRYQNWVNDNIKRPLAMTSLRQATGISQGYEQRCHILRPVLSGNSAWKLPGGGWESNIIDLAKFANALLQGDLLNNTHRLWTTVAGNPTYGYGVKYSADKRQVWHEGKHDDSRALLYLYPGSADSLGIVLMINGAHSQPRRIAHHIAKLFGRHHNDADTPVIRDCNTPCRGRFSALWAQTGGDVLLRRGYDHASFLAEWNFLRQAGYYSDDVEPYTIAGKVYWDAIFRKGQRKHAIHYDLDRDRFIKLWSEQSANGYHLVDMETYRFKGRRFWAGLFRPDTAKQALLLDLTTDELNAQQNDLAQRGYQLTDVEAYTQNGLLYWAGVWRAGPATSVTLNQSTRDFHSLQRRRMVAGYRLIDIETYRHRGRLRWAGIWLKQPVRQKLIGNAEFCDSDRLPDQHGRPGMVSHHNRWRERGYELIDWEPRL